MHNKTNDSSVDEYRSVIDDLTVENRKLKERLRKLEGSSRSSPQLEKDRLFEVKIHGLPPQKRRELEETLRTFAANHAETNTMHNAQLPTRNFRHPTSGGGSHNPSSTSASNSNSQPIDSAYASISNSGPTSTSISNRAGLEQKFGPAQKHATEENVQSFLHNIPKGLLPKSSTFVTERQKKKAVVRRMEQVFTGNAGIPAGEHSQPMQQQEVSNSATRADRNADGLPFVEGLREAHILPYEMDVDSSNPGRIANNSCHKAKHSGQLSSPEDSPDDTSLDQRPTRPLDLDPDRAQIPSDNVDYIRHLGLSTPQFAKEDSSNTAATGSQGWIPLNLVMGMAQLHIINVTPDFVRSAVEEVSEKFHLSKDGQKVRWRGGTEGTRLSSDSGESSGRSHSPRDSDSFDNAKKKRRKVDVGRFAAAPIQDPFVHGGNRQSNKFNYRPLFHHRRSSDEDMSSFDESDSPLERVMGVGSEAGTGSRVRRFEDSNSGTSGHAQRQGTDGPIIFYNGASFCTDLSGDRGNAHISQHVATIVKDADDQLSQDIIGHTTRKRPHPSSRTPSGSSIPYRPFKKYLKSSEVLQSKEQLEPFTNESMELDLPLEWSTERSIPDQPLRKFSACGLGGTIPADHFSAKVETRRTILDGKTRAKLSKFSAPSPASRRFIHSIPKSILNIFQETKRDDFSESATIESGPELPVKIEFVSAKFSHLEPSPLPAPLRYYGASSSASSSDNGSDCSGSGSPHPHFHNDQYLIQRARSLSRLSDDLFKPHQAQDLIWNFRGMEEDGDDNDEQDDSKDGSDIDLLGYANRRNSDTAATKVDIERGSGEAKSQNISVSIDGESGYSSSGSLEVERNEDTD